MASWFANKRHTFDHQIFLPKLVIPKATSILSLCCVCLLLHIFVHFIRVRLVVNMRFAIFRMSPSEYYRHLLEVN